MSTYSLRKKRPRTERRQDEYQKVQEYLKGAQNILVITGSGISVQSGLSTFSAPTGLYERARKQLKLSSGDRVFAYGFYEQNTKDAMKVYAQIASQALAAAPSASHKALARLHRAGHLLRHFTLNVDGLAEAAGVPTCPPSTWGAAKCPPLGPDRKLGVGESARGCVEQQETDGLVRLEKQGPVTVGHGQPAATGKLATAHYNCHMEQPGKLCKEEDAPCRAALSSYHPHQDKVLCKEETAPCTAPRTTYHQHPGKLASADTGVLRDCGYSHTPQLPALLHSEGVAVTATNSAPHGSRAFFQAGETWTRPSTLGENNLDHVVVQASYPDGRYPSIRNGGTEPGSNEAQGTSECGGGIRSKIPRGTPGASSSAGGIPRGTIEMHGRVTWLLCPRCEAKVAATLAHLKAIKAGREVACQGGCGPMRFGMLLYDDQEAELITPATALTQLRWDAVACDIIIWAGISFHQSASVGYFDTVLAALEAAGKLLTPQVVLNPDTEVSFNLEAASNGAALAEANMVPWVEDAGVGLARVATDLAERAPHFAHTLGEA